MIREGKVLLDLELPEVVSSQMEVFYNPHMRENRDISLLMLLSLPYQDVRVCDPMGASGIRLLRMLLETNKVKLAVYNDISPKAVEFFKGLIKSHGLEEDKVEVYQEDACLLLRKLRNFHYVDIDPLWLPRALLGKWYTSSGKAWYLGHNSHRHLRSFWHLSKHKHKKVYLQAFAFRRVLP